MLRKIQGSQNIADAFTKYLSQKTMNEHLHRMNTELRQGRAQVGCSYSRMRGRFADGALGYIFGDF